MWMMWELYIRTPDVAHPPNLSVSNYRRQSHLCLFEMSPGSERTEPGLSPYGSTQFEVPPMLVSAPWVALNRPPHTTSVPAPFPVTLLFTSNKAKDR